MLLRLILACSFALFSCICQAFDILPKETFYNPSIAQSSAWKSIDFVNTLSNITNLPPSMAKNTKAPPLQHGGGGNMSLNKLVAVYPADIRQQVKRNFNELFTGYRVLEKRVGFPKNDLAGALTVYIGSNYLAYTNLDLPRPELVVYFKSLYSQTRKVLRASRGFAKLNAAKKRRLYEQLAIMGALPIATRTELLQEPNLEVNLALQDGSRRNLEALFSVAADRIIITPSGLVVQ